ncbi:MAG: linear amide C-N hydrolase [Clostridia bacterium]|nr:linear amide C-N hydrolase [Clostridia bacterium]
MKPFSAYLQGLKNNRLATIRSARKLDDNLYLLDYRSNYHLPELMERGVSSIGELMAFAADALTFGFRLFKPGTDEGAGCTTFDAFTPEGKHLLARNFDFKTAPCFVVWTHPDNGYASVSVVDNNFMAYGTSLRFHRFNSYRALLAPYCCVDGMNEKGLAIAVLQLRAKATNQKDPCKKDITTTAMIRAVLDTCANIDEAVALIKKYNMHDSLWTNYHYQIVDASGRSTVVEYIDNVLHVYERGSAACSVEGSVYEDDGLQQQYAANFSLTKEIGAYQIEQHGADRAEAVKSVLRAKDGVMTELDAMALLSHVKLDYKHTKYPWNVVALWSAVYNTGDGTMKIAANKDYRKIYTFSISTPCKVLDRESIDHSPYPDVKWSH